MICSAEHGYADESELRTDIWQWLSSSELEDYELRPVQTRLAWLLGRVAAKQLLRRHVAPDTEPADLQIFSRDGTGRGMRPQVFLRGQPRPCSLSIAHTGTVALAALSTDPQTQVGVDVVKPFVPARGFIDLCVTASERSWLETNGSCGAAGLWAIKEAVYKATNHGEPFRPASIEVHPQKWGRYAFINNGNHRGVVGVACLGSTLDLISATVVWEGPGA